MKRERQFEVMRTIAMFFIVIYHILTHGVGRDVFFNAYSPVSMTNILFSDFLLVFCSISVNLYVMVSGYFLADLNFKMSRIVRIWVQTCFYSSVITIIMMSLGLFPFNIVSIGKSFFPLSTDAYWFVTQFIGLMILSPLLMMLIKQLSYKQFVWLAHRCSVWKIEATDRCQSEEIDFKDRRFTRRKSVYSFRHPSLRLR